MKKTILYPLFVLITAAIDILTKFLIVDKLQPGAQVNIFGNLLKFHLVLNRGLVFGLPVGSTPPVIIVLSKTLVIALVVYIYLKIPQNFIKKGHTFTQIALLFIFSGFIGNAFDRLYHGAVVDFIDIGIGNVRWYIFNLADVYVVTGGLMILLAVLLYGKEKHKDN
ncbi:signal peptidase II [candidate division KSB1 bacterium]|nr:signal peptidase II [candidate division KSB1 bacterium]